MNTAAMTPLNVEAIRADFRILDQTIHRERPLIYLDNGASTQHPNAVIDAMSDAYRRTYANVHRGIHFLSERSSEQFEAARTTV
jgi:cysteine desulfurase/selenocysteine lyase